MDRTDVLPETFSVPRFMDKLQIAISTVMDFMQDDDKAYYRHYLIPELTKAFISSEYVASLQLEAKKGLINKMDSISFILNTLADVFTDEVLENEIVLQELIKIRLLPNGKEGL